MSSDRAVFIMNTGNGPGGGRCLDQCREQGRGSLGTVLSGQTWLAATKRERVVCARETSGRGHGIGARGVREQREQ